MSWTEEMNTALTRENETWDEERRIGHVGFDPTNNTIAFYRRVDCPLDDYFYWFQSDECATHDGYHFWFEHLSHKMWFKSNIKFELQLVLERLGYNANLEDAPIFKDVPSKSYPDLGREVEDSVDYDKIAF